MTPHTPDPDEALVERVAPPPYATSSDAYRAVHRSLAHWVAASLDDADATEAMKYAALMREIEEHTDVG